jgi:hypothetical protein
VTVATRRGGNGREEGWTAPVAWPDFGNRALSASADVAYVAGVAAAILSESLTEAAQEALTWVFPRDDETER